MWWELFALWRCSAVIDDQQEDQRALQHLIEYPFGVYMRGKHKPQRKRQGGIGDQRPANQAARPEQLRCIECHHKNQIAQGVEVEEQRKRFKMWQLSLQYGSAIDEATPTLRYRQKRRRKL